MDGQQLLSNETETVKHGELAYVLGRLADQIAEKVAKMLRKDAKRELVGRDELARLTGLGIRTIDRMAKGGSWEKDSSTGQKLWRATDVRLEPIKQGGRVLYDRAASLTAIRSGH